MTLTVPAKAKAGPVDLQLEGRIRIGGKVIVAGIPADDVMTFSPDTVLRKGLTIKMVRRAKHTY